MKCQCCGQDIPEEGTITFNASMNCFVGITDEDMEAWERIHPDAVFELTKMELWLATNPTKRKKLYRRFITKWLIRAADKLPKPTTTDGLM